MFKRLLCLCLACILTLCGCDKRSTTDDAFTTSSSVLTSTSTPASTTSKLDQVTTSAGTSSSSSTTREASHTITTQPTTSTVGASTEATASLSNTTSSAVTTQPSNTFTATVRNEKGQPVSGITVSVRAGADILIGHAITDKSGKARIPLSNTSPYDSYRIELSNLPAEYEAKSEYVFYTSTVNITVYKKAVQNESDHSGAQYEVGKTMTDFELTDTDGNVYRLSSLLKEKKLVILDFWFTACEPCKMEFPYFEAAMQAYGDDIALLAVDPFDSLKAIANFRKQLNAKPGTAITFPMLQDTCKLYLGFDVISYPTTVFIDENGQILTIHKEAYPSEDTLFAAIERYLH